MPTFVALLRGVNVGKAKRVPMAELRSLLSGLGYTGVSTLLNSGNAVFRSAEGSPVGHAAGISAAISDQMQIEVPVIVKTHEEFEAVAAENPISLEADKHSRLIVTFVQDTKALPGLESIGLLASPSERFFVGRNAAYLHCPKGLLKSKVGEALLKKAGPLVTTRNWATVLKLLKLANETEA